MMPQRLCVLWAPPRGSSPDCFQKQILRGSGQVWGQHCQLLSCYIQHAKSGTVSGGRGEGEDRERKCLDLTALLPHAAALSIWLLCVVQHSWAWAWGVRLWQGCHCSVFKHQIRPQSPEAGGELALGCFPPNTQECTTLLDIDPGFHVSQLWCFLALWPSARCCCPGHSAAEQCLTPCALRTSQYPSGTQVTQYPHAEPASLLLYCQYVGMHR